MAGCARLFGSGPEQTDRDIIVERHRGQGEARGPW
jgi:hypothetical protein